MPLVVSERTSGSGSSPAVSGTPPGSLVGLLAIAVAAALWAIAAIVARDLFDAGVPPLELAEARAVIAAAGFVLLHLNRRGPKPEPAYARVVMQTVGLGL